MNVIKLIKSSGLTPDTLLKIVTDAQVTKAVKKNAGRISSDGAAPIRSYVLGLSNVQASKANNLMFTMSDIFDGIGKGFPSPMQFKRALEKSGKTYIGEITPEFKNCGISQKEVLSTFDRLSIALRNLDCNFEEKWGSGSYSISLPKMKIKLGDKDASFVKLGNGKIGHVYKLGVDGQPKAFKVFNDAARIDTHGSYAETGFNLALNRAGVNDCIDLYFAGPGWSAVEYGSVDSLAKKTGHISVSDYLKSHGLFLGDDWGPNRGPGGIVWDLGGIEAQSYKHIDTIDDFRQLFDSPLTRMSAGRKISHLQSVEERYSALMHCMQYPETRAQAMRSCKYIPEKMRTEILSQGLDFSESAGRAAFEIDLAPIADRSKLFKKALTKPEARTEAAKMIDHLPEGSDRLDAFMEAWKYPECRPMATRCIKSLPSEKIKQVEELAMSDPGSRFVLLDMKQKSRGLSAEEALLKNQSLVEYFKNNNISISL